MEATKRSIEILNFYVEMINEDIKHIDVKDVSKLNIERDRLMNRLQKLENVEVLLMKNNLQIHIDTLKEAIKYYKNRNINSNSLEKELQYFERVKELRNEEVQ